MKKYHLIFKHKNNFGDIFYDHSLIKSHDDEIIDHTKKWMEKRGLLSEDSRGRPEEIFLFCEEAAVLIPFKKWEGELQEEAQNKRKQKELEKQKNLKEKELRELARLKEKYEGKEL